MLLFRDEEHVSRWRRQWQMSAGAMLPLDVAWRLAQGWFDADRSAPEWRRPAVDTQAAEGVPEVLEVRVTR